MQDLKIYVWIIVWLIGLLLATISIVSDPSNVGFVVGIVGITLMIIGLRMRLTNLKAAYNC